MRLLRGARPARHLSTLACGLVLIAPYIAYEIFRPPPFDITVYKHHVDYEFRDSAHAADFAERNDADYA